MTHYPNHVRDAFIEWAEAGFPRLASIEVGYEPHQESAKHFLRRFVGCSDVMPRETCDRVAGEIEFYEESQGMSYGLAAEALLAVRRPVLCRGLTKKGRPCRADARPGNDGYCLEHDAGPGTPRSRRAEQVRISTFVEIKRLLGESSDGMTLTAIRVHLPMWWGREVREKFEQDLRNDADVVESRERRPDSLGRSREQVVLRLREPADETAATSWIRT
jgi:hypothetical protein